MKHGQPGGDTLHVWNEIREERAGLVDLCTTLQPSDWDVQSLCDRWRIRHVVAHLVHSTTWSKPRHLLGSAFAGFDVNRFIGNTALRMGAASSDELLAAFRSTIDARRLPPGGTPALFLCDVLIHGQDMRRPLNRPRAFLPERLRFALTRLAAGSFTVPANKRIQGLRLIADDIDWATGSGAEIRAAGEVLLLLMAGRVQLLGEARGEGLDVLASRLGSSLTPQTEMRDGSTTVSV